MSETTRLAREYLDECECDGACRACVAIEQTLHHAEMNRDTAIAWRTSYVALTRMIQDLEKQLAGKSDAAAQQALYHAEAQAEVDRIRSRFDALSDTNYDLQFALGLRDRRIDELESAIAMAKKECESFCYCSVGCPGDVPCRMCRTWALLPDPPKPEGDNE